MVTIVKPVGADAIFFTNSILAPDTNVGNHTTLADKAGRFVVGAYQEGTLDYWSIGLDEIKIFGRALSASDVTNLYNATVSPSPARP